MKAVLIFSGGLDSTTLLYKMQADGYEVDALTFNYAQRHKKEIDCAKIIASRLMASSRTPSGHWAKPPSSAKARCQVATIPKRLPGRQWCQTGI